MSETAPVILLTPLAPARTGNGLAMRAGMLLSALSDVAQVRVVVVPIAGPGEPSTWAEELAERIVVISPVTPADSDPHIRRQLANARLRARLEVTAPLPARATLAPPTLADVCADALGLGAVHPPAVVGFRLPLAPLVTELARVTSAGRIVVDVDEDDEVLLHSLGDSEEAGAHGRLAREWLPDADVVLASTESEAVALAGRHALDDVRAVPNTVETPSTTAPLPRHDRLLFVGNLTYRPNLDAARRLATEILPSVIAERPTATLDLVGAHEAGAVDDLAELPGVRIVGFADDLAAAYADADVVVTPLTHGAGTRIKLLEAFAHRRPVVATAPAASGLDVVDGVHLLLAESDQALAEATVRLLADHDQTARLTDGARKLVDARYTPAISGDLVQRAVWGATAAS